MSTTTKSPKKVAMVACKIANNTPHLKAISNRLQLFLLVVNVIQIVTMFSKSNNRTVVRPYNNSKYGKTLSAMQPFFCGGPFFKGFWEVL